ncbi:zinc ribbon domain-containing protein [Streptococcus suis]|uniref:zinc ribbon domain-containing protein n=1 Tax=Streptococcus suis TaxID=1307 RepID=UPI0037D2A206
MVCGECGGFYDSKCWHFNSKYRRVIYRCKKKYEDGKNCQTPHATEEEITTAFIEEVKKLLDIKEEVIDNLNHLLEMISDTTSKEQVIDQLKYSFESTSE